MLMEKLIGTGAVLLGLACSAWGAYVAANAVLITPHQAVDIGVARWAGDTFEENVKVPAVQNLLRQSQAASWGLKLILIGTILQVIGTALLFFV